MQKTNNYKLTLYDKEDKMNITSENDSLNANMIIIDNALNDKTTIQDLTNYIEEHKAELKGDPGEQGIPGIQGEPGKDGENGKDYVLTETDKEDISKLVEVNIPTKLSELENDKGYLTSIPNEYVTETELSQKGYATESFVTNKIAEAELSGSDVDLSGLATKDELNNKVDKVKGKSLIDDTEITRLSGVTNYNDTELKNQINSKATIQDMTNYIEEHKEELKGADGKDGINGKDGTNGQDGYSPIAKVETTSTGATITITDKTGTTTSSITNGKDGEDGYTPVKGVDYFDGSNGTDGQDGYSPVAKVIQTETGATITITDKNGTTATNITNGKDYVLTETDKQEIVDMVDDKGYLTSIPSTYKTKTENDALYQPKGNYLTSYTETDPTVPSHIKSITTTDISNWNNKSDFSGRYNDLTNKPTKVSAFENDKGYLTSIPSEYITENELNEKKYATKDDLIFKVDKVEGKSLMDDTEIERLKNVTNYNDTELKNQVNSKASITDMVNYIEENKTVLLIGEENPLRGKSIACIGDSIMESRTDNTSAAYNGGGWPKIIGERNNMMVNNIGKSGSTLSNYYSDSNGTPTFSAVRTINAQIDAITESDYIIFDGCINDWSQNKKIGVITEGYGDTFDKETILGGLEYICYVLNTTYHTKKYGYIFNHRMVLDTNSKTNIGTWIEFRNKIKEVLEKWAIPYLDLEVMIPSLMYLTSLKSLYTGNNGDGIHPNEEGYRIFYCDKIEAWLRTLGISSTEKEPVINYTNLVHTSIDSDGAIYNSVGYKNGLYLSEGNATSSNLPCVTTGFIPANGGDVVRIAGVLWEDITYNNNTLYAYDSNFTCLGGVSSRGQRKTPATAGNEIHSSVDVSGNMGVVTLKTIDTIAYIRVASMGDGDTSKTIDGSKMIVTINEEII